MHGCEAITEAALTAILGNSSQQLGIRHARAGVLTGGRCTADDIQVHINLREWQISQKDGKCRCGSRP